ncbi:MAG TPA: MEKHLA domain-containing protein [Methylophilaceae bacterium]|jgi:hypothetical protein
MMNQMQIVQHTQLLADSYASLTGKPLIDGLNTSITQQDCADLLWNAPVAIVSHGIEPDPVFNYGNALALRLFEYSWEAFTQLPSRFSAEADQREARAELLEQVSRYGFFDGYHGVRVSQHGKKFKILDATIWNVLDANAVKHGQAAIIRDYRAVS